MGCCPLSVAFFLFLSGKFTLAMSDQPRANNSNQSLNSAEGTVQCCASGTHYFAEGAGLPKALAWRLTHACNQALAVAVLALHACAYYLVIHYIDNTPRLDFKGLT